MCFWQGCTVTHAAPNSRIRATFRALCGNARNGVRVIPMQKTHIFMHGFRWSQRTFYTITWESSETRSLCAKKVAFLMKIRNGHDYGQFQCGKALCFVWFSQGCTVTHATPNSCVHADSRALCGNARNGVRVIPMQKTPILMHGFRCFQRTFYTITWDSSETR